MMIRRNKNCRKLTGLLFFCGIFLSFCNSQIRNAQHRIVTDNMPLIVKSPEPFMTISNTRSWDKAGKEKLVEQAKPWMSRQVQALICSYLNSTQTVMLEYGGGGSTLFFSQYVKFLYTVESVGEFYQRLTENLFEKGIKNVQVLHRPPNGALNGTPASLEGHKYIQEMRMCDIVNKISMKFWLENGGPQGIKLPPPPTSLLQQNYHKFKGNYKHNSAYIYAPMEFGITRYDVVLIDGVARGACAFWILDYIDENSRVFIHDFFNADSSQNWEDKFNLNSLQKYYHVVAKMEELSPYISGGTVVVLQKKTKAEIAQDTDHMNRFQKRRNLHRGNKAYKDFF